MRIANYAFGAQKRSPLVALMLAEAARRCKLLAGLHALSLCRARPQPNPEPEQPEPVYRALPGPAHSPQTSLEGPSNCTCTCTLCPPSLTIYTRPNAHGPPPRPTNPTRDPLCVSNDAAKHGGRGGYKWTDTDITWAAGPDVTTTLYHRTGGVGTTLKSEWQAMWCAPPALPSPQMLFTRHMAIDLPPPSPPAHSRALSPARFPTHARRTPHRRHLTHLGRGRWKSLSEQRWAEWVGLAGLVAATVAAIIVARSRQLPSRVLRYSTVTLR